MKLLDFLDENHIVIDLGPCDKNGALNCLVEKAAEVVTELESQSVLQVILEREELGSTGIGGRVAIPHGKLPQLRRMSIFVGKSREGVEFDSIDNLPVNIIFLLLAPDDSATIYLKVLARVSKMLKKDGAIDKLLNVNTCKEMLEIIEEMDSLSP